MNKLEIIIPVKNEVNHVVELVTRISHSLRSLGISYRLIFIDDHSSDDTLSELDKLKSEYPVVFYSKIGKPGKAYSILEGLSYCESEIVGFIDGDLQYSPEHLPKMYEKIIGNSKVGVVVANRKTYKSSMIRRLGSRFNAWFFGKVLLGLNTDVQSGLKLFRRDIVPFIDRKVITNWSIDMPLLVAAHDIGYFIDEVDISYEERTKGTSKVNFIKTGLNIASTALRLLLTRNKVHYIDNQNENHSIGSGVAFRKRRYITHSKLPYHLSAIETFIFWQRLLIAATLIVISIGFVLDPIITAIAFTAVLSAIYFADVVFNLFVVLKSLHFPPELFFEKEQLKNVDKDHLPMYTILCPLYKESEVLPSFVENMSKLNWPKDKLDILLLLEEDDSITISKAKELNLPSYFRTVIVPHSYPKTKPKACNYGLHLAKGEYIVIYDAEDEPDPDQLMKAYLGFTTLSDKVVCLQAKLNYHNPHHNLLTRLFTAEYSLWFDVVLPGFQSIDTAIPLGGTSNHFKTSVLKKLHGWDAFNVTEDCDLGVKLFREGYKTAIIDSVTLEEANSNVKNWIRQRSRWIKGYMQTYLVHMRNPLQLLKKYGWHSLIFHLVIGARMYFMLINPLLWAMTASYFLLYQYVGPSIEAIYPTVVFYMAAFSLVVGNFVALYNYMIGCAKRGHWELIKFVFLVPFYWALVSISALVALYQLIVKPHYWEKTDHGLHLKSSKKFEKLSLNISKILEKVVPKNFKSNLFSSELFLVGAGIITNLLSYAYNAYLTRSISTEEFGLISLMGSLLFITTVPLNALSRSITYKTAFYLGKYKAPVALFWRWVRSKIMVLASIVMLIWLLSSQYLVGYFKVSSILPLLFFAPVWLVSGLAAVDSGYLTGNLKFKVLGIVLVLEALFKLAVTWSLVSVGLGDLVYISIPASAILSFFITYLYAREIGKNVKKAHDDKELTFPNKFFGISLLLKFSVVAFLSFDVILAKHYLAPDQAGYYAMIALIGKMIFFIAGLFTQFVTPLISKEEGAHHKSKSIFYKILALSTLSSFGVYLVVGLFGSWTAPLLFGSKIIPVVSYLPIYGFGMFCFTIASGIISYYQIKNKNVFPILSFIFAILQIVGIGFFHNSLDQIVFVMVTIGIINLFFTIILHFFLDNIQIIFSNFLDFLGLFKEIPQKSKVNVDYLNILIMNWYDTKHVWGGGAEIYLHNLSKRLVRDGHRVTMFCGNDNHSSRYDLIDGVTIVRRGGLYSVPIWAFIYYLFKFRGKYDVIIDSAKGVPFFTPLYVKEPVLALVCHVHQEMFRTGLKFPLREISMFLEKVLMPLIYHNTKLFTISESTKSALLDLGFGKKHEIQIIYPGFDIKSTVARKSAKPLISYVGRLRFYKRIDTLIYAFALVQKLVPDSQLMIVGTGEAENQLKSLVKSLRIENKVSFMGRVSDELRNKVYKRSWMVVQPSIVEGWGMTNIEANYFGTPVVASDVEGLRESVKHNKTGLLFEPCNEKKLSEAILALIHNPVLRESMGQNGKIWSQNFSWELGVSSLGKLLFESLDSKKSKISVKSILFTLIGRVYVPVK